ncbi:hypothetical protein I6A60_37610 [Frankia sp. AgB1.9]|nr:hypothetical protein [Frankia sp. AgW1.1]MBL7553517.1 hypothetical protein [Frankia sp. AgB1.9]MBL7622367.1 hypothetical protein [Frankia sp. AgB1.8]
MDVSALLSELRALARGQGLRASNFDARVGPALRHLAGLRGAIGIPMKAIFAAWLQAQSDSLPEDLRLVASVAFGLDPRADQRLLTDRLGWLAVESARDPRTIRRQTEQAFLMLAETMAMTEQEGSPGQTSRSDESPTPSANSDLTAADERDDSSARGWYVERIWAVLRLDGQSPELLETRRIVALEDGLSELILEMTLPQPPNAPDRPRSLEAEILFGGRLTHVRRKGQASFSRVLHLPRALRAGEQHDFGLAWLIPPDQPLVPRYVLSPTIRCDSLDIRVRFPGGVDPQIELVDGLPLRAVGDLSVELPSVAVDGTGEAFARFDRLALGLSYGLRWRNGDTE